jgi:uncharacterized protein YcfL
MKSLKLFLLLVLLVSFSCKDKQKEVKMSVEEVEKQLDSVIKAEKEQLMVMDTLVSVNTKSKSLAPDKYWFYVRTSQGGNYDQKGFHYSQILKCPQKVTTPGIFNKQNAVGPFNSYSDASMARRDEVDLARDSGMRLIPKQAVCNTRWD